MPDAGSGGSILRRFDRSASGRMRALTESEARYRTLADLCPDAILVNVADRYVYANAAAARMLGAESPEALLGASPFDFLVPEHHALVRADIEHLLTGQLDPAPRERQWRRLDGVTIAVEVTAASVEWSGETAIQVLARDVTERHRVEAQLRESEERYRLATAALNGYVYEWELGSNEVRFSRGMSAMLGYPECAGPFTRQWWQERIHPDDVSELHSRTMAAVAAGRATASSEYRVRHADGRWIWIADHATSLLRDGAVVRVIGNVIDITERKRAEESLQEADRRKDEFLATLAHELRNPLAPIRTAAHVLGAPGLSDAQREAARAMIVRQSKHLSRLVDDLMEISRLTLGRIELKSATVNLSAMIDQAIEASASDIEAKGHALHVERPAAPLLVHGDAVRLAQVLTNLLTNAAEYTPRGGHIVVGARAEGPDAVLSVRDSGIGIPPDMLERVFDMFTQVPRRDGASAGGLGIGLALVRRLVAMHGGRVEVASEGERRGSEFVVRIPRLDARPVTDDDENGLESRAPDPISRSG